MPGLGRAMRGGWWVLGSILGWSSLATGALAADEAPRPGGFSPTEASSRMVRPEGFSVAVAASEPDVRQPVAAAFDERGRLWVIEYLQYPNPAGLKPVKVDRYLRTVYDKVPEPPPHGPRGVDRIRILEDRDGDGRYETVKTFVEGLNLASAIAVGHGGVFVGQAPYLLFYADKNRDDVPDGDPEVLLKGFGLEDAHATVNSLAWGPDGWLYGAQGSTVTADIAGIGFQQGIWRYDPRGRRFELFAEGGGNTWGLDFDRLGHAFGSSNGHFITFHMVQGGYYWKGFAKHGPLHNPRAYGYFDAIGYEGPKQGGHVTPGGIVYKGAAFPPAMDGAFVGGNLLSNSVYWHRLKRNGSTFTGTHGGTLIDAKDSWFRPIDLLTAPDGSVLVVDWYDKRASHLDPRDNWDKSNGRIYRVTYGEQPQPKVGDLSKWSTEDLLALRTHRNDWWPDTARRVLAERRDESAVPRLKAWVMEDREPELALRDLWALNACGGLDDATAERLLEHPLADVRRWVVRLLGDDARITPAIREQLMSMARSEPDADVRSQLASSARRWEAADGLPILETLASRDEDVNDTHIPLLIWWGIEDHWRTVGNGPILARFGSTTMQGRPMVKAHLIERMARALAASPGRVNWEATSRLLADAPGDEQRSKLVAGLSKGLEGRFLDGLPGEIEKDFARLWTASPRGEVMSLGLRLGSTKAWTEARKRVADASTLVAERKALIDLMGQAGRAADVSTWLALVGPEQPPEVQSAALAALGAARAPEVAGQLLAFYPKAPAGLKPAILDRLCSRKDWAMAMVESMGADKVVDPKSITAAQARQIGVLGDSELIERFESIWGRVPTEDSEEIRQKIAAVRGLLVEGDRGDAKRGAVVFRETCAACHKMYDDGVAIGPELTGVDRNQDFLLESVIHPGALVRKEYQATIVALSDGRVLTGLVVDETPTSLTLFDSQKQKTVLAKDQVEEMRTSERSLMPDGLLEPLGDDKVRDLFKFLQTTQAPK